MKDDKIEFQWGDRYIKAEEIVEGVGGKYWKWNEDKSITEFKPPELRFNVIKGFLIDDDTTFDEVGKYKLRFESEDIAKKVAEDFNDYFWSLREVSTVCDNCIVEFNISDRVLESTYTPAKGPND